MPAGNASLGLLQLGEVAVEITGGVNPGRTEIAHEQFPRVRFQVPHRASTFPRECKPAKVRGYRRDVALGQRTDGQRELRLHLSLRIMQFVNGNLASDSLGQECVVIKVSGGGLLVAIDNGMRLEVVDPQLGVLYRPQENVSSMGRRLHLLRAKLQLVQSLAVWKRGHD